MYDDLKAFFLNPNNPKRRQYEALRAYVLDGIPAKEAADRFGFTEKSLFALAHDLRNGKLDFFPRRKTGPNDRRLTPHIRNLICELRKQNLSVADIVGHLRREGVETSPSTVERVLKEAGQGAQRRQYLLCPGRRNKRAPVRQCRCAAQRRRHGNPALRRLSRGHKRSGE